MTHNKTCKCDECLNIIKTMMTNDGMTLEDYHDDDKRDTYRELYEVKMDHLRVMQGMRTHKDIMKELLDEPRSDKDKMVRMMYQAIKYLNNFTKFIHEYGMKELMNDERTGEIQWERFINCDRDTLRWYNGMDSASKQVFIINLSLGDSMIASTIRTNS